MTLRVRCAIAAGLSLAVCAAPSAAQSGEDLCQRMEASLDGASLVRESAGHWQVISRRKLGEPAQVGVSAAKGELARHLTSGRQGGAVKWSGATQQALRCDGYKVVQVSVDAASVRFVTAGPEPVDMNSPEIEELIARRLDGTATRDELLRLRDYYVHAGDLAQARQLAEQALQLK